MFFSGLLFAVVSPGPNFAEFQKTRAGGPLGKFDIARLHGHFKRRGLQQNVLLGWHFKEILVRTWWHWRQGVFSGLLFAVVSPGPNFAEFQKTRAGGPLGKFDIARLHGHFKRRGLQQNVLLGWHFKEILVRTWWHWRQGVFSGLLFAVVSPGPNFAEFQKTRAGGPLGKFDIARLHGHFKRRGLQQNVLLGWHFKEIVVRTWWHWRQGVFSGLLFAVVSPGPNFAEFQKTRAGGPLGKFDIARLHGHFKRRGLQQNVLLGWHFKEILVRTWWHWRQGVFSGLLFAVVSPGPNFAEFQKTRAGGPLGKFDIARLHGHFKRRGLQQNVLLGWHFKEILVRTWWHWRQGVFSGLLFAVVSPGPNFAEFQKTRAGGPLGKFDIARLHGHFKRRGLQQNVLLGWHFKEILVRTWWHWRQGVFSGLLFAVVSPGPNFAEFQKTRAGGPLGKFDIARLHGHFKRRGLQQNVLLGWHFKEIIVRTWWHWRQGVFSGLLFAVVSPGPNFAEFQKTRAGGPLGKFDIARLHGHFKRRGLQQNVLLGWHFKEILVRTWWHWRQGVFSGLLFAVVSPGPNFAEFQKTRAGGPLGKFDIARLHGHFKRRGLQQNVLLGWHFKEILVRTWWHWRQGVFSGLLFAVVSPGPNFAEFQKTRAGGPLGKFDIARLHGHFKRRGLQQNVLLGWHFKEILVRTWWHWRQGVFSGLLFAVVSPGPNFAEFQKTRAGGPLGKFDIARLHGHFKRRGLQQNVLLGWHFKEILEHDGIGARVRLLKCPWSRAMSNLPRGPPARVFWNSAKLGPGQTTAKRRPEKTPWRQCHHVLTRISLKCQPSRTFCCKPRLLKCPWSRAMSNLPRGPPARVFWNSAKLGPGETTAKRRPEKTPWRQCHHVLTRISLKCQPSRTFCCKPRLLKCPWSRAMSNLPRGPPARVFWNSAKLGPGETTAKRRPEKTPWRQCHHVLTRISLKCQPSRTFCCKPRLLKCPWSRAMSNLPRGPPARVFWNSAKLGPGETTAKRRPEKTPWRQCHHVLTRISLKCQPSRTFCCKPRLLKCPWSRAMSNLPRGPPARVFWNSAKLGPGETTAKRRPEKTPWRQCHHVLTRISLKCQPSRTFCCKPRLLKCPWSRAMSNLPRGPPARVFWNSAKLGPGETTAKRRPEKTPWRQCHHVLTRISLKCQPSRTFCCKPRLLKCPWSRAMSNLPRGPPARVFWNSAKLGPGETTAKRRPEKTPWRQCHHVLTRISLKCQPSRTFCCKPRLLKCPWSRAMSNLPRGPPARVFWNSAKLGPGETTAKRRPEKTPWRQCHHVLTRISLKCQPSRTFCCKPRLLKCPWSRAMSNLPRGPPARVFWNSAKLGPGETTAKRRPEKTPWRQCHHVLTRISLKCQPSRTFCCKPRLLKCPWSRAMSNLPRGPPARVFWNSAKLGPGETTAKRRPEKTPWRQCHHVLTRFPWSANLAEHFAANRAS